MSGNDDRHGGDDGFDDDIHFSDEELEAALDGFEKEFRDSNAAAGEPANDAAADSPADDAGPRIPVRHRRPTPRPRSTTSCKGFWATRRRPPC